MASRPTSTVASRKSRQGQRFFTLAEAQRALPYVSRIVSDIVASYRLAIQVRDRLERLAESTHRSRSFLAADAIEKYVSAEEWQVAGVQQALDDDRPGISDEKMAAWMDSLGTDAPLPMPKPPAGKKSRRRR